MAQLAEFPSFLAQIEPATHAVFQHLVRLYHDEQLAEEISHDSVSHAFEKVLQDPNFFATRDLLGYIRQHARWRAIDRLRMRGRMVPLQELHDGEEEFRAPSYQTVDFARQQEGEERRQRVWSSLALLEPEDRFILESYYYDRLTDQEIGAQLYGKEGTSESRGLKVWRRRKRAYERLAGLLEDRVTSSVDPESIASLAL
ncbi:MAG: hypothetical protein U0840_20335 [Gemmataceae bacterium]